ncbi:DgyrCDS4519 [Dimorphilus gyrociliatus]|uniref:DgyrCDS4519 n=1 Tax=Dimorphilus gyrociliatus TaxID=2664684 RepID=A0A7I8VGX4_9ANNE|nr:DgyrCDS4519 [Dimorphilus gyrociliatus]
MNRNYTLYDATDENSEDSNSTLSNSPTKSHTNDYKLCENFHRKLKFKECQVDKKRLTKRKKKRSLLTSKKVQSRLVAEDPKSHGDQFNTLTTKKENEMNNKRVSILDVGISSEDQRKMMKRMAELKNFSEKTYKNFMRDCQEARESQTTSRSSFQNKFEGFRTVNEEKSMQLKEKADNSFFPKVLVLGNRCSGKTTLINRLTLLNGQVSIRSISTDSRRIVCCSTTEITYNIDDCNKGIIFCDLVNVKVERDLLNAINQCDLVVIVYKTNSLHQLESVHDFWITEVEKCDKKKCIIVVGMVNLNVSYEDVVNRLDTSQRDEQEETLNAQKDSIQYVKCDVNDKESIMDVFKTINDSLPVINRDRNKFCCIS